jgi:hypothetical protein
LDGPGGALSVVVGLFALDVVRTVEFDDEPVGKANEIDDVRTATIRGGWCPGLTAEFVAAALLGAEQTPELLFSVGARIAESAREVSLLAIAIHEGKKYPLPVRSASDYRTALGRL